MVVLGSRAEFQIDIGLTTPKREIRPWQPFDIATHAPPNSAEARNSYLMVLTGRVSFEPKTSYRKRLSIPINRLFIIRKLNPH